MTDISLREGEDWKILLSAHEADGTTVMTLPSGTEIEFRISDLDDTIMTQTVGSGVNVLNEQAGTAEILVTAAEQAANGITATDAYFYEVKVIKGDDISIQAEGRLVVDGSLFAVEFDPLLRNFRTRFPEFTEDDNVISIYIQDAKRVIDEDDSWIAADRPIATVYLAAHLLMMRKTAAVNYANAGGITAGSGAVRTISVEDRTVMFDTTANRMTALSKTGLAETAYGKRYLSMLRHNVIFLKRA